jgi:DNA helicase HerA-like ATPase
MPVLGKAIAVHLRKLKGLYSVELPARLQHEIVDLVSTCNKDSLHRAVFVTDDGPGIAPLETVSWAELLQWRTSDDRIFAWERGSREPDTSFQNVVKPFISSRFPGSPAGECNLDLLAELSTTELWRCHGLNPIGDAFDEFLNTAKWVAGVLRYAFERVGSTPSAHWSDEFLVHWAKMLSLIDPGMSNYLIIEATPQSRHAWELVRVAGLPVPARLVGDGNPFRKPPQFLEERDWPRLAKRWQDIVETHMLTEADRSVFLTALDQEAKGAEKTSSWRDLDWNVLASMSSQEVVAAPAVGQKVFTSATSPSLFLEQPPTYPGAPRPAWWGVTEADIQEALKKLATTAFFRPTSSCVTVEAIPELPGAYWLKTRLGTVSYAHSRKRWKAEVLIEDLEMTFKAQWNKLTVSHSQPRETRGGHAWINPEDVSLKVTGGGVQAEIKQLLVESGTQLLVRFDLTIAYTAEQSEEDATVAGKWNPARTLQVKAKVRDCIDGSWESTPRNVDLSVKILIPSPFSPTVLVIKSGARKPLNVPGTGDRFVADVSQGGSWEAEEATPDFILKEEGTHIISVYDGCLDPVSGAFMPKTMPLLNDTYLASPEAGEGPHSRECNLDEGDVIRAEGHAGTREVAVVKVRERSANLSSGLLSAVRGLPAGQKPPSTQARSSLPGQYQDQVTRALCNPPDRGYNSLYQYVVSTSEIPAAWPKHSGNPAPEYLFEGQEGFLLPGIGNGPSPALVGCSEWLEFMKAMGNVCEAIGLQPGREDTWLSGFDPSVIPGPVIKAYVDAQCNMVQAAKKTSWADTFWSSYPFSVTIVEGAVGASKGQLLAVLLAPLHPARLAWAYAVAFLARHSTSRSQVSKGLIGLAEGWNIPCTGCAVSIAGQALPMVAIPIDPGREQDFATWSALAVLDRNGLARLPAAAAGLPLPWAGQTGINQKVVARALKDYLAVHPYLNSLEVDIRSVSEAPRSNEIDDAVLKLVGGVGALEEVDRLSGGTRVQDSIHRSGPNPTRDDLFLVRQEGEHNRPFEWRRYQPQNTPSSSDIAFIENSSVHLAISKGSVNGLVGYLPVKRFYATALKGLVLEQNYSANPEDDLLGLSSLLAEIEYGEGNPYAALQAIPQAHALGIGMGARWEILGTFNIDPTLLSSVVAEQAQTADKRLLWEWRPSWLSRDKRDLDIAKRPYYVVGRIPPSLLKALHYRQGFTEAQAFEMLLELGRRGIGLTSLHAAGGAQESAAAGFFYALRLLLPPIGHALPAKWMSPDNKAVISGLIPLDPIEPILEELAGEGLRRRADLLAVRITQEEVTRICLVPIEVKHHGQETDPEPLPNNSNSELKRAREQLFETVDLIEKIAEAIYPGPDNLQDLPGCYARLTGLATLLELAMSLAPTHPAPENQAKVLSDVLRGKVSIGVGHAVLLWFAPGTMSMSGEACIVDLHGATTRDTRVLREMFIDPAAVRGLWGDGQAVGLDEEQTRELFDEVMKDALSACIPGSGPAATDVKAGLVELLGLVSPIEDEEKQAVTPRDAARERSKIQAAGKSKEEEGKLPKPVSEVVPGQSPESKGVDSYDQRSADIAPVERKAVSAVSSVRTPVQAPEIFVGSSSPSSRWTIIGKMAKSGEGIALDLDHPKAMGIFGYMGSGKSYLLGTIVEAALEPIPSINELPVPLAVVIFNYRRNALDRFELSSLALPNQKASDVERLAKDYGALPLPVRDIHILCLPGELGAARIEEYGRIPASELYFDPATLTVEDWELLMGEPGSGAVFARTIRHALRELRYSGEITLESLEDRVTGMLKGQSRTAAQLRFEFVRRYLSRERGVDFTQLLKPGRAVILDLRQPLFNKNDALRFFLVCSGYVSRVQGQFNKLVIFDEAHEYVSDEFGERIDARIREMRHEGTSYIFATQDVGSIPSAIRRFITNRFVFDLGTRENIEDLLRFAPEFEGYKLQGMEIGHCLVQSNQSVRGVFGRPRLVHIRPRVTQHGGASRIFSATAPSGS